MTITTRPIPFIIILLSGCCCCRYRKLSLECLQASGLEDRNRYLPAELDLWDLWGTEDPDELKEQLLKSCQQFLDKLVLNCDVAAAVDNDNLRRTFFVSLPCVGGR